VEAEIKEAEKIADITIVMPQSGVEYSLEPTEEQQTVYRQMIDFGADIIFGGHPHVAEPTEIVEKDGEKKFIIYSMGNLLSNQRYETVNYNYWTERGVIPEVEITKEGDRTYLSNVTLHPTWVSREPIPNHTYYDFEYGDMQAYDFQVVLAEDYLPDGQYANQVPEETRQRIETAYHEMIELLDLKW
jgi:poly-gamma-glutamate synthesis protein (capsule biosynthesis protein)